MKTEQLEFKPWQRKEPLLVAEQDGTLYVKRSDGTLYRVDDKEQFLACYEPSAATEAGHITYHPDADHSPQTLLIGHVFGAYAYHVRPASDEDLRRAGYERK